MNAFVDKGAARFATAAINWASDTIKMFLADASFTPTYDSHGNINNAEFLSDVSSSMVGSAVTLAGKGTTAGILTATNPTFPTVSGNTVVRVWCYKDTGVAGTSPLLFAYDTGTGLPLVPNGTNVTVFADTGAITGVPGFAIV